MKIEEIKAEAHMLFKEKKIDETFDYLLDNLPGDNEMVSTLMVLHASFYTNQNKKEKGLILGGELPPKFE